MHQIPARAFYIALLCLMTSISCVSGQRALIATAKSDILSFQAVSALDA